MLRECFGRFGEGDCLGCQFFELCSGYFVVEQSGGRCPFWGRGFRSSNEMCRLCVKYFDGEECKRLSKKRV